MTQKEIDLIHKINRQDIANGLKMIRMANNYTQSDLSQITGIQKYRISNLENEMGPFPNLKTIEKLVTHTAGFTIRQWYKLISVSEYQ